MSSFVLQKVVQDLAGNEAGLGTYVVPNIIMLNSANVEQTSERVSMHEQPMNHILLKKRPRC